MAKPLVSVIIPLYNREHLIRLTLESVVNQTYKHFEVIIVDDGSTDNSSDVAKQLLQKFNLAGRVYSIENSGLVVARDYGVKKARGSVFFLLDSDDLWLPEYLETMVAIIIEQPESPLVFCDFHLFFDDGGPEIKKSDTLELIHSLPMQKLKKDTYKIEKGFFTYLLQEQPVFIGTVAIRRSLYEHIGAFGKNISGKIRSSEWEFFLRCAHQHAPCIYLKKPLAKIRKHESNRSKDLSGQLNAEIEILKIVQNTFPLSKKELKLVNSQIASRSLDCGYQYFARYQMKEARPFFKRTLLSAQGGQAAYYLLLSMIPVPILQSLRKDSGKE